jgi:hypothetical protein
MSVCADADINCGLQGSAALGAETFRDKTGVSAQNYQGLVFFRNRGLAVAALGT